MNFAPRLCGSSIKGKILLLSGDGSGAKQYYLQSFVDSGDLICPGMKGYTKRDYGTGAGNCEEEHSKCEVKGCVGYKLFQQQLLEKPENSRK